MDALVPASAQTAVDTSPLRTFTVVFIPADNSQPLQEETIAQTSDRVLSAMIDHAKARFAQTKLTGARLAQYQQQLSKEHGTVPEDALSRLADMTLCEVVPLLQQQPRTFHVAVNLVVDDKAVTKELPMNERATSISSRCGLSIQVRGDAFLCRQFDNDEGFYRLNFTLRDLSTDVPVDSDVSVQVDSLWIPLSRALRFDDGATLEKIAREYKERGNHFYKLAKFPEAAWRYQQAMVLTNSNELKSQVLSNQSACRLKLGDFVGALADADACVAVRPVWGKAWGRRAEALKALGRPQEAEEALKKAGLLPAA